MPSDKTGQGTAALRAIESNNEDGLINDPFAHILGFPEGSAWVESLPSDVRNVMIDLLAVRTRLLDDICIAAAIGCDSSFYEFERIRLYNAENDVIALLSESDEPISQIVILGSGYDTRAYRLAELGDRDIYEVDFGEVLEAKNKMLSTEDVSSVCRTHHLLHVDLSSEAFSKALLVAGFKPQLPTLWLLEGLTGYLNEADNKRMVEQITELSYQGSIVVATFIGKSEEAYGKGSGKSERHQYYTDESSLLYQRAGWYSAQRKISELSAFFGRSKNLESYDYWITFSKML